MAHPSLIAHLKPHDKKVVFDSVSQFLCRRECTVPSNDCLASRSSKEGSINGQQVRFPVFFIINQINIKALFYTLMFLKKL